MSRRCKKRRFHFGIFFIFLTFVVIAGVFFIPWVMKPENFRSEKNAIYSFLYGEFQQDSYNAKSLLLVDRSNNDIFISKKENEQQLPASLSKLFVIEYAATIADLDSIVPASYEAISLTKPGSSVAGIEAKDYFLHNLFAAMLVPSGNDAAYVVADYCGGILSQQATTVQERINIFMDSLNTHLQEKGYTNTVLYDPSGYDMDALTTVLDLNSVVNQLLEFQWFRDIISQSSYIATLPDGSTQSWKNTNTFLDSTSDYYNENVIGVKTGSLSDDYNLIVLYRKYGKEFLICSLGSQSDSSRYDDVNNILKTIDESDYLKNNEQNILFAAGRRQRKKAVVQPMSLSYHRQADLAFAQKQVEEFSSACFLFLPNTNRQIFICLKKLYSLIQIYATLYKKP